MANRDMSECGVERSTGLAIALERQVAREVRRGQVVRVDAGRNVICRKIWRGARWRKNSSIESDQQRNTGAPTEGHLKPDYGMRPSDLVQTFGTSLGPKHRPFHELWFAKSRC